MTADDYTWPTSTTAALLAGLRELAASDERAALAAGLAAAEGEMHLTNPGGDPWCGAEGSSTGYVPRITCADCLSRLPGVHR